MRAFALIAVAGTAIIAGIACSGCMSKYPRNEDALAFSYPLRHCDDQTLAAAGAALAQAGAPPRFDDNTLCVTRPLRSVETRAEVEASRLERQAFSAEERRLRKALETPFTGAPAHSSFGIALSGGGSKAAAFAIGVMAGLSDAGLLDRADYISSVSGGGYAAYFYYAHHLFPLLREGGRPVASSAELFADCISDPEDGASPEITGRVMQENHCRRLQIHSRAITAAQRAAEIRYQALLKCTQDLLRPGECDMGTTAGPDRSISWAAIGGTIASLPFSLVSNTLFDWGYSTSPSGRSYRDGIGLSYGSTLKRNGVTHGAIANINGKCGDGSQAALFDCLPNLFDADPQPLTFDELRRGLLRARVSGQALPFWIINATATRHRSVAGWMSSGREDITNSDMFEMTAVSHGSGRYGYVSAPASIHDMTVLDAVAASAAFLDANQLVFTNRLVRTGAGVGQHLANLDWGYDIANYNVSTARRKVHRVMPFPLYWLDSFVAGSGLPANASAEVRDRQRSVFIRLIDGGNAENLGVYSLLKRGVGTIVISDAAADEDGLFGDICGLRSRLARLDDGLARHVYVPGLADFENHCKNVQDKKFGYNIHGWNVRYPVLMGCIRAAPAGAGGQCSGLSDGDVRLLIVKPALNFAWLVAHQMSNKPTGPVTNCHIRGHDGDEYTGLLNCDSTLFLKFNHGVEKGVSKGCPIFPQHSTVRMTANSSGTLFVAYRELARQYAREAARVLGPLMDAGADGIARFEHVAAEQQRAAMQPSGSDCTLEAGNRRSYADLASPARGPVPDTPD